MNWERIRDTAMQQNKSTDSVIVSIYQIFIHQFVKLPLRGYEKVLLKRYIENELHKADFLDVKDYKQLKEEIFLFAYFAGHGCADTSQYFVLNEDQVEKCFWNAERRLI